MDLESFRTFCLSKPGVEETQPFGPNTLVFKVYNKVFAITGLDSDEFRINLKCDPDYALELREQFQEIIPGWHMNKKHWNTVLMEGSLKDSFIVQLIDHSFNLVTAKLPKHKTEKR